MSRANARRIVADALDAMWKRHTPDGEPHDKYSTEDALSELNPYSIALLKAARNIVEATIYIEKQGEDIDLEEAIKDSAEMARSMLKQIRGNVLDVYDLLEHELPEEMVK